MFLMRLRETSKIHRSNVKLAIVKMVLLLMVTTSSLPLGSKDA